jgi:hypothetical protein
MASPARTKRDNLARFSMKKTGKKSSSKGKKGGGGGGG